MSLGEYLAMSGDIFVKIGESELLASSGLRVGIQLNFP